MKVVFLFTGKTENSWVKEGLEEYVKKLKHYCQLECVEIPAPRNAGSMDPRTLMEAESAQILTKVGDGDKLVVLDEKGKEMTSVQLSEQLNKLQVAGTRKVIFAIGGAFGFHQSVYDRADLQFSFSQLTFTHQMIRVILAEQIYRAFTILKGEKYHHR